MNSSINNTPHLFSAYPKPPGGLSGRLNIYTTSTTELWPHFPVFQDWIARHGIEQALTLLEVKSLFETLKVELEATAVR